VSGYCWDPRKDDTKDDAEPMLATQNQCSAVFAKDGLHTCLGEACCTTSVAKGGCQYVPK
jgi:hypothetical protein